LLESVNNKEDEGLKPSMADMNLKFFDAYNVLRRGCEKILSRHIKKVDDRLRILEIIPTEI